MGKIPTSSYYEWPTARPACGLVCQLYLYNGWRCFARAHAIEVEHWVVFKYAGHGMSTVKVFDETMCCHDYHSDEDD
jgi:hypothetical protein